MLKRIIAWSVANKLIVVLFTIAAVFGGVWALKRTPLEALPDLSDVQVIVQAEYSEQAPRIVEDQDSAAPCVHILCIEHGCDHRLFKILAGN